MSEEFMDEIDRDLLDNGPGEQPHIRLAKSEQQVRELTATNRRLEAELAEARKDGERLDEAARGQYSIRYNAMNEQWEVTTGALHPAHRRYAYRKTIRAAIDAARGTK